MTWLRDWRRGFTDADLAIADEERARAFPKCDATTEVCGNCMYWPLAKFQHSDVPSGTGGHGCDGTKSDCRRSNPIGIGTDQFHNAKWPTTDRLDWCGEFDYRTRAR